LPLVPDEIGLRGAIFADAGSLFGTSAAASKFPGVTGTSAAMRASVGVGLIWDSPVGPLRADYAFPLAKQTFDKTQPFSFGLATF
jgi:outer membrane protein insertion porin family